MATKGMKFHRHRCEECKRTWRHSSSESNRRNHHAHMCPGCGDIVTEIYAPSKAPKSIRGVRKVVKRVLAHALASNLKPIIATQFSQCGENARLLSSHGLITITLRYPYKPSKRMPK